MSNASMLRNDFEWAGRTDTEDGEKGSRWHQKVTKNSTEVGIGLLGFGCDLGVIANKGRPGAQAGPDTIRQALANFAWHLTRPIVDAGTITAEGSLQAAQSAYAQRLCEQLQRQDFVIGLGGGHEIAWGSYNGLLSCLAREETSLASKETRLTRKEKVIGILNFDAHFDLRRPAPQTSSGTPFYQIAQACDEEGRAFQYACLGIAETANTQALFEIADRYQVRYLKDMAFNLSASQALMTEFLQDIDELYVTICLDVFPNSLAPGVSAPSALGICPNQVIALLHWLANQQTSLNFNWRLADIAEMNPTFDTDARTAKLAARLVYEISKAVETAQRAQ